VRPFAIAIFGFRVLFGLVLTMQIMIAGDLDAIRQEPNLERRSDRAMENANGALDRAREAYKTNGTEPANTALMEVGDSVDLALDSLETSGKDARRNPKFFKRAELSTREILRRIDGLRDAMDPHDRGVVEKVRDQVSRAHEELIEHMMGKKHNGKK